MISALFLGKLTVVLLLGAVSFLLSRKLPAAARHLLCASALGITLLLPLTLQFPAPMHSAMLTVAVDASSRLTTHYTHSLLLLVAGIWTAGSLLVLLSFGIGYAYIRWQTRHSFLYAQNGNVSIRIASVTTPLLCGWFTPIVLMPFQFRDWDTSRQHLATEHELAHYRRFDHWTALVTVGAKALYWFHPLVWWLSAKLEEQRELACDDRVLQRGVSSSEYASLLVDIARQHSSPTVFGCAMFPNKNHLKGRIMHILKFKKSGFSRRSSIAVAAAISVMALTCLLIPARAHQQTVSKAGGDFTAPKVLYKIEPQYAEEAKREKIQGIVLLGVTIGTDGKAQDIHVIQGLDPELDKNAAEAISQWQFAPATKGGRPVPVESHVEVHFRLK